MMIVRQTNRFRKAYKKLHKNQLADLHTAIEAIIADFNIGEQKKGDLSWLHVYKFKMLGQLTLLGYINPAAINLNYLLSFALFFGDGALPRNAPIH
ncbi:MAG: type II toxin-antitoxin system RelE/ParE family toxin [Chitinispirillales bacterium]|jgi:hypothetical protein|nr:type II toxin-antitoxin system RelE/ParE family toxin [Chitinispirillales bacterium]